MADDTLFTNILVPTDGSKGAMKAAEHAVALAKQHDGAVHAIYVMDMGDADFVATPNDIAETRRRLEKKGREYTDAVADLAADAGVDCTTTVKTGAPVDEILEYVAEHDIDLVALGRRGRSDPDKPLVGSITGRVVKLSPVPVHTV